MVKQERIETLVKKLAELKDLEETFLYGAKLALQKREYHHAQLKSEELNKIDKEMIEIEAEIKSLREEIEEEFND